MRKTLDSNDVRTSAPLPEVTYTAESQLRRPRQFFQRMVADVLASRELAWRLLLRDIRSEYRRSLLSYLWIPLPALAGTLVWVYLKQEAILQAGETEVAYPVYVLIGTLLWQGFVDALGSPLQKLTASRPLLTKLSFPWEAIVFAGLGEALFKFAVRLVLVFAAMAAFQLRVTTTTLMAPLGMLALLALGGALGLLLAPVGLLYQDVGRGLSIATRLWFFVTPVVYPPPTAWPASLIAAMNPVTPLLVTTRDLMTSGELRHVDGSLLVAALTPALFLVGLTLQRLAMPHVVARLSVR